MKNKILFIDQDGNEDWIKTTENRKAEAKVHADLEKKLKGSKA
jgi:hypothetical protein